MYPGEGTLGRSWDALRERLRRRFFVSSKLRSQLTNMRQDKLLIVAFRSKLIG
jgi:hypothetical protein